MTQKCLTHDKQQETPKIQGAPSERSTEIFFKTKPRRKPKCFASVNTNHQNPNQNQKPKPNISNPIQNSQSLPPNIPKSTSPSGQWGWAFGVFFDLLHLPRLRASRRGESTAGSRPVGWKEPKALSIFFLKFRDATVAGKDYRFW